MQKLVGGLLVLFGTVEESNWLRIFDWLARFSFAKDTVELIKERLLMVQAATSGGIFLNSALIAIGLALLAPRSWWIKRLKAKTALLMVVALVVPGIIGIYFLSSKSNVALRENVTSNPSILDLYVNAFNKADIRIDGFEDIDEPVATRVNYTVLGDIGSKTKYILYYIPHSKDILGAINALRTSGKDILAGVDATVHVRTRNLLDDRSEMLKDFMFSGAVYIFYEDDILDNDQIDNITLSYRQIGETLWLRSAEFKLKVWDEIKLGRISRMPRYEINKVGRIIPVRNGS